MLAVRMLEHVLRDMPVSLDVSPDACSRRRWSPPSATAGIALSASPIYRPAPIQDALSDSEASLGGSGSEDRSRALGAGRTGTRRPRAVSRGEGRFIGSTLQETREHLRQLMAQVCPVATIPAA